MQQASEVIHSELPSISAIIVVFVASFCLGKAKSHLIGS